MRAGGHPVRLVGRRSVRMSSHWAHLWLSPLQAMVRTAGLGRGLDQFVEEDKSVHLIARWNLQVQWQCTFEYQLL